jgi:cytochrome c
LERKVKRLAAYFMFAGSLFAVPGIAAAQDLAAGEASFHNKCRACHAVGVGAKNTMGPDLNGLVGRQAGTAGGYQYSPAGKNAGFAWDQTSFTAFIANPRGKIPGNKMVFVGIKDETEIANLWAYLSHFNVDGSSK